MKSFETLTCALAVVQITKTLSKHNLHSLASTADVRSYVDHETRNLVLALVAQMPAVLKERIVCHQRWPKNWWQALKDRWLPQWLLGRFPVEWERVDIDQPIYAAVCPHVKIFGRKRHVQWMFEHGNGD